MAKFLSYEDRLEIQNGLKEHLTFTEIGKKLGRDRTTITKEVRNYSVEQDTGYSVFPPQHLQIPERMQAEEGVRDICM